MIIKKSGTRQERERERITTILYTHKEVATEDEVEDLVKVHSIGTEVPLFLMEEAVLESLKELRYGY